MREKLTPAFIRDAPLPTKGDRVIYWDTAMPSFGLMVTKNGARSFVYQYRNKDEHRSRRKTWAVRIDGSNTGLTLSEAHKEAKKLAGDVEKGADPVEERREGMRSSLARTRERLDRYTLQLQEHGLESADREVRWLTELIEDEKSPNTKEAP